MPTEKQAHSRRPWHVRGDMVVAHRDICGGQHGPNEESVLSLAWEPEVRKANARLIAAAPELLECLRDMVCKPCDTKDGTPHPWCDRARQVIKRVTGHAS